MAHKSTVRNFDFMDTKVSLPEAIRTIRAGLEDEGLTLSPNDNTPASRITSVLIDGVKRVIVPSGRIIQL